MLGSAWELSSTNRTVTSIISFEPFPRRPDGLFLGLLGGPPHSHIRGFPVCLSDHGGPLGSGLQTRRVPALAIAFAPAEVGRSMPTRLSQASDSGFDSSVAFSGCDEWCPCLV